MPTGAMRLGPACLGRIHPLLCEFDPPCRRPGAVPCIWQSTCACYWMFSA